MSDGTVRCDVDSQSASNSAGHWPYRQAGIFGLGYSRDRLTYFLDELAVPHYQSNVTTTVLGSGMESLQYNVNTPWNPGKPARVL